MGVPTLKRAKEAAERADAEWAFWQEHYQELLEKYPDQFVAVMNGQVVAVTPDIQQLVGVLEGKGIGLRSVWVSFVTSDPRRVLL